MQNEPYTTLEHQGSPNIHRQGCGTPAHRTLCQNTKFTGHKPAMQNNSPGGHSKREIQRKEKPATRQLFHPTLRMVENWRSNRLSNNTSGINLQPAELSVERTDFFWAGSCSVQLMILPLKAIDSEYIHIYTCYTSEQKCGSISSLNGKKTSLYNQWQSCYLASQSCQVPKS